LQLLVFAWQGFQLRNSVDAAEKTANSMQNSERAYICVEIIGDFENRTADYYDLLQCHYIVKNVGKTPAFLTNINCDTFLNNNFPDFSKAVQEDWIPKGGVVIGAGKSKKWKIERKLSVEDTNQITKTDIKLYCCGRIIYRDIFKRSFFTKFCWEYQERKSAGGIIEKGFYLSANKEFNDYT
jgi:hypothetical protein